jgi:hypothetical protein
MDFVRYYVRLVRVALTHSFHAAHGVLLIFLIVVGVIPYLDPRIEILVDPHGWAPAALIVVSIIAVRLCLAPFWIWKEDQKQLATLRQQLASRERDERQLAARTTAIDQISEEIAWAVNNLVNPRPHPGNSSDPENAIAAFEAKFNSWCKQVSKKLENRGAFTQGDQTHFDHLGFVPVINTWAHSKLNHVFGQLALKIERLREIEQRARERQ